MCKIKYGRSDYDEINFKGHEHDVSFNPLPNSFNKVPTTFITRNDIFRSAALQNLWR